jgi:hypothetical protein
MSKYSWSSANEGNIVGTRLANEMYHRFSGDLNALSFDAQKDAALAELLVGLHEINVKSFGAKGDSVTDDTAAIQAALAALGGGGGTVLFPESTGAYIISDTLLVLQGQRLLGHTPRSSQIRASADFPVDTPLVILGPGVTASTFQHACRIENLVIHCNSIAGSIGVLMEETQEMSGVFNSVISNFGDAGIRAVPTSQTFSLRHLEINSFAASDAIGIDMNLGGPRRIYLQDITVNTGLVGTTIGFRLNGCLGKADSLHCEGVDVGVLVIGGMMLLSNIDSINATAPTTALIQYQAGSATGLRQTLTVHNATTTPSAGETTLINDETGESLTDYVPIYRTGFPGVVDNAVVRQLQTATSLVKDLTATNRHGIKRFAGGGVAVSAGDPLFEIAFPDAQQIALVRITFTERDDAGTTIADQRVSITEGVFNGNSVGGYGRDISRDVFNRQRKVVEHSFSAGLWKFKVQNLSSVDQDVSTRHSVVVEITGNSPQLPVVTFAS